MGRPINSFKISPLDAGKLVVMRCSVIGGRPAPKVVWYLNNEPIPSTTVAPSFSANSVGQSSTPKLHSTASSAAFNKNVHVEKIELGPLSRFHQDARLTCRASNSLKENPVSKTIMLEITRKLTTLFLSKSILLLTVPWINDQFVFENFIIYSRWLLMNSLNRRKVTVDIKETIYHYPIWILGTVMVNNAVWYIYIHTHMR